MAISPTPNTPRPQRRAAKVSKQRTSCILRSEHDQQVPSSKPRETRKTEQPVCSRCSAWQKEEYRQWRYLEGTRYCNKCWCQEKKKTALTHTSLVVKISDNRGEAEVGATSELDNHSPLALTTWPLFDDLDPLSTEDELDFYREMQDFIEASSRA